MRSKKLKTSGEIGGKIKKKRREMGISQEELAERLGVTYQQVQRYENGRNKLNVENIQVIANSLDVPAAYFFSDRKKEAVSEDLIPYLPAEESRLLGYFRKIRLKNSRSLVLQVARLASRIKT